MYLPEGADHYEPIAWERAFEIIAAELRALGSPDEAVFYTSGRTSNEAAFLYQLFAREFGTNNLPDCSNMCHESSGSALTETIGVGKGSVLLEDLYQADLIIVAGQNPGTNHPRMLSALEKAKPAGARIVTVNPLPEAGLQRFKNPQTARGLVGGGTPLTDLFLQIRLGGDLALFRALNRLLLEAEDARPAPCSTTTSSTEHTHGFEEFAAAARATDWDAGRAPPPASTAHRDRRTRTPWCCASRSIIVCWAMGLTQHKHSVPTIREIVNFLLLRGNIGRPGAGVCPVRGHSNVQGDRTMGIFERPAPAFLDALETRVRLRPAARSTASTSSTPSARCATARPRSSSPWAATSSRATPDTDVTEAAMRRARLTVHVSTKLNRSHAVTGAPRADPAHPGPHRAGRAGRRRAVRHRRGLHGHGARLPRPRSRPPARTCSREAAIVCRLARAVARPGQRRAAGRSSRPTTTSIRDRDRPRGARLRGLQRARSRDPGGFTLPHAPRDSRRFPTATGKANFTVDAPSSTRACPRAACCCRPCARTTSTTPRSTASTTATAASRAAAASSWCTPTTRPQLGLADGAYVDLVSEWTRRRRAPRAAGFRVVHYPTARGCAAAYYPETNVLVPLDHTADISNTPASQVRGDPPGGDGDRGHVTNATRWPPPSGAELLVGQCEFPTREDTRITRIGAGATWASRAQ